MSDKTHQQKSRREFISTSLKAGIALSAMGSPLLAQGTATQTDLLFPEKPHPLNILILGGTSFLGPQQIAYALQRGHSISIFTRGKTQPTVQKEVFKKVEHLVGDRENNLEALKGRKWDAVIDNSGRRVKWTKATAELLKDNVGLYLYTSSTGVYYPYLGRDIDESTKLVLEVPDGISEIQKYEYDYGVMKANSEIEAQKAFGQDRTIIVRPTYMLGPGDKTNRFPYWPIRLNEGGRIMIPGKPGDQIQYADVRDVAQWMIRLIELSQTGTFNAVGPASPMTMPVFVHGAHAVFNSAVEFVQIRDYKLLAKHGILDQVPWIMPTDDNFGSALISNKKGIQNGLTFTPLAETVRDVFEWRVSDAEPEEATKRWEKTYQMYKTREAKALEDWAARHRD
ncbi:MAG: NAD-dependent epimerase/dehydratase family protein [Bacteroidetes bacterium]|nr:MAG: NAD-dependent epimerase/dehydratase family protein [Bacteroidota bacterium]